MSHIPVELTYHVLDSLPIQDLVSSMAVCRLWRRVGRSMPAFWRDIELTRPSDSALALFRSRLEERPADSIRISIVLKFEDCNFIVTNVVVPLLVRHIPRCTQLSIHVHIDADAAILAELEYPSAPLLETLSLAFYGEIDDYRNERARPYSIPLPTTLFACTAPRLRRIYIRVVDIRQTWPAAFGSVTSATFDYGTGLDEAIYLDLIGAYLPALKDLTLIGNNANYVGTIVTSPSAQRMLSHLEILRVYMTEGMPVGLIGCGWSGFALMPHICTTDTTAATLGELIPHVGHYVALDAKLRATRPDNQAKDEFDLRYISLRTSICRSFIGPLRARHTGRPVLPGLDLLKSSLRRFEFTAELWPKLAGSYAIPTLPACTDVFLKLSPRITLADIMAAPMQLQCPALRAVVLSSSEAECDAVLRYTAAEVAHLITSLFARVERVVHVTLRAVDLDGELDGVSDWIQLVRS